MNRLNNFTNLTHQTAANKLPTTEVKNMLLKFSPHTFYSYDREIHSRQDSRLTDNKPFVVPKEKMYLY